RTLVTTTSLMRGSLASRLAVEPDGVEMPRPTPNCRLPISIHCLCLSCVASPSMLSNFRYIAIDCSLYHFLQNSLPSPRSATCCVEREPLLCRFERLGR